MTAQITTLEQAENHLYRSFAVALHEGAPMVEGKKLLEVCGFNYARVNDGLREQIARHSFEEGSDFIREEDLTYQRAGRKPVLYYFTINASNHALLAAMTPEGREARQALATDVNMFVPALSVPTGLMSSFDFWKQLNTFRQEAGESKVQHSHFLSRCLDELSLEEGEYKTFIHPQNNQTYNYLELDKDQMLLVGMRESKIVRRKVLGWLKTLSEKAEQPMTDLAQLAAVAASLVPATANLLSSVNDVQSRVTTVEGELGDVREQVEELYSNDVPKGCLSTREQIKPDIAPWLSEEKIRSALKNSGWPFEEYTRYIEGTKVASKAYYAVHPESGMSLEEFFLGIKCEAIPVSAVFYVHQLINGKFRIL